MFCTEPSHRVVYEYNEDNNVSSITETVNGTTKTYSYTYDDDNRLISENADGITVTYTYDDLGRLTQKQTKNGDTVIKTDSYTFTASTVGTNGTSSQVASYNGLSYTYDDNANILSVSDGTNTTTYQYDSANQLVRENNQALGVAKVWTYDSAGNITSRKEYAFSDYALQNPLDTVDYEYNDADWGDKLTSYDGRTFEYDSVGNLTDDEEWEYAWQYGRQLASMSNGTTTWTYTYDANGMRTKRTNGTYGYEYVYDGSQLVSMTVNGYTHYFSYDATGIPLAITINDYNYYYVTNLQGDVIGILDQDGNRVATYLYDAWGNVQIDSISQISDFNPLLYRGYVYDHETELYYLQSRYYNPEWGRFINADDVAYLGADGTPLSYNLFAYCANNPFNRIDPSGEAWWHWALGAAVVAACAVATVVTCGGFAAAATAVCMVGSGVAAATTASTIAAGALIGSMSVYGMSFLYAASSSSSVQDFNSQGSWGLVFGTVFGGLTGGYDGYTMSQAQAPTSAPTNTSTNTNTSRGSTGRTEPANLREQLAMEQVKSNPSAGTQLTKIQMNDPRWPSSEGWIKMQQIVPTSQGYINIHYVHNPIFNIYDDFKFK